jgi:hypothetical protein
MPTKPILLWRLCDWYTKTNPPINPEQLIEVFKIMTKASPVPRIDYHHHGSLYWHDPIPPKLEPAAAMYRHVVSHILKTDLLDWDISWIWEGRMAQYANLFDADEIAEDEKVRKAKEKYNAKHPGSL